MSALRRWAIALGVLLLGRKKRQPRFADRPRIVPSGEPDSRAEWLVLALLLCATVAGVGFIVVGRPVLVGRTVEGAEEPVVIRALVRYLDERSGTAPFLKKALRYVFPDIRPRRRS